MNLTACSRATETATRQRLPDIRVTYSQASLIFCETPLLLAPYRPAQEPVVWFPSPMTLSPSN